MSVRPLRIGAALDLLPDLDDLAPLREALIDASHADAAEAWAGAGEYITVGRRIADPDRLDEVLPAVIEKVRARTERIYEQAARAVRALADGDAAAAAAALVAAGEIEEAAWRLDAAEAFYRRASEVGRKPRDRRGEALALKRMGRLARVRGDVEEALRLYRAGTDLSLAAGDSEGTVVGCTGVGNVYVDQGQWEEAGQWYRRGMEHVGERASAEFLHLCNALSVVERRLGRFEEASRWLDEGESAAADGASPGAVAYLKHGRARLLLARGEVAEAEAMLREMVETVEEPISHISGLINLAEPLMLQERHEEAMRVLRQAEDLAIRFRAPGQLAYAYEQMGRVAASRRDSDGFLFFEQALDLVKLHRLPLMQKAGIQHAYGLHEAGLGAFEAGIARLRIAQKAYREAGAALEVGRVEMEMDELAGRSGAVGEAGRAAYLDPELSE